MGGRTPQIARHGDRGMDPRRVPIEWQNQPAETFRQKPPDYRGQSGMARPVGQQRELVARLGLGDRGSC